MTEGHEDPVKTESERKANANDDQQAAWGVGICIVCVGLVVIVALLAPDDDSGPEVSREDVQVVRLMNQADERVRFAIGTLSMEDDTVHESTSIEVAANDEVGGFRLGLEAGLKCVPGDTRLRVEAYSMAGDLLDFHQVRIVTCGAEAEVFLTSFYEVRINER